MFVFDVVTVIFFAALSTDAHDWDAGLWAVGELLGLTDTVSAGIDHEDGCGERALRLESERSGAKRSVKSQRTITPIMTCVCK